MNTASGWSSTSSTGSGFPSAPACRPRAEASICWRCRRPPFPAPWSWTKRLATDIPPTRSRQTVMPVATRAAPRQVAEVVARLEAAAGPSARCLWICPATPIRGQRPGGGRGLAARRKTASGQGRPRARQASDQRQGPGHGRLRGLPQGAGGHAAGGRRVPAASIMVDEQQQRPAWRNSIELRGRVGRGGESSCKVLHVIRR